MKKLISHSPDLTARNIERLAELFPTVVTEGLGEGGLLSRNIDFDLLRQELSGRVVEGPQERYHLDWPGKREALFAANAPIAKTLRPVRKESVEFDTTQNLFIEGDNLDALKLLQESYLGKVKVIYIDPPYNTGSDRFIFPDDYALDNETYLKHSGQIGESGMRLVSNMEATGRFHSNWLTMMYPRLKLARNLLTDDGLIFISIDDHEVANLKEIADQIFGSPNFLNVFVWVSNLKGRQITGHGAAGTKEYVLVYARNIDLAPNFRGSATAFKKAMPSVYKGFNYEIKHDSRGPYVTKNELHNTNSAFNEKTRPNLIFDIYYREADQSVRTAPISSVHLHDGYVKITPRQNNDGIHRFHAYRWSAEKVQSESFDLEFVRNGDTYRIYTKVRDVDSTAVKDLFMDISTVDGATDLNRLEMEASWFDYPKPVSLIRALLQCVQDRDFVVLDFFAGSGTTAQAVWEQNAADGGRRRSVLVQLPEPTPDDSEAARAGFSTIADLTKERIRRVAGKIGGEAGIMTDGLDLGFRAFKVDSTNMTDVLRTPGELQQGNLDAYIDSVKPDRGEEDLLFQVLLSWGLELTLRLERQVIDGKVVFTVDDDALIACFEREIDPDLVRELATRKPFRAVFLDAGFPTDADRVNIEQIFAELSPGTEVRAI